MKLFVDTNIFADYYLDRSNHVVPLGEFAFQLIKRSISCEFYILTSDDVITELKRILNKKENELNEIIFKELIATKKIQFIKASENQAIEAEKLSGERNIPRNDALFAVLARDNKALLISRDNHYYAIGDIAEVRKPEEL
ncbi:MAG: PIN domain-containing protein [Candidatus Diapherotrites archaeon]|nr:PIN domain-containing protein [Candidatus Diapherotrites archaeon]